MADIIIIAGIVLLTAVIVRNGRKRRKEGRGSCCGSCPGCGAAGKCDEKTL